MNDDALVVGTVTASDPRKIGLATEVYHAAGSQGANRSVDTRQLTQAAMRPAPFPAQAKRSWPAGTVVSTFLDASAPNVRDAMRAYASAPEPVDHDGAWYRISMDLFSEFAS